MVEQPIFWMPAAAPPWVYQQQQKTDQVKRQRHYGEHGFDGNFLSYTDSGLRELVGNWQGTDDWARPQSPGGGLRPCPAGNLRALYGSAPANERWSRPATAAGIRGAARRRIWSSHHVEGKTGRDRAPPTSPTSSCCAA